MAANTIERFATALYEWCSSGSGISKFLKRLFTLFVLLHVATITCTAFGLLFIHLPRVCVFIILLCLVVPCFAIVLAILYGLMGFLIPFEQKAEFLLKVVLKTGMVSTIALFIFGFIIWGFAPAVSSLSPAKTSRILSSNVRLPLGEPYGIAIDPEGNLYLALQSYGRIQKYSPRGDFISGWFVDAKAGFFVFWMEEDGLLHADVGRTHLHRVFDLSGNLLTETEVKSHEESLRILRKAGDRMKTSDSYGNTYSIHGQNWLPRVVKVGVDGDVSIVLEDPLYLSMLKASQPAYVLFLTGLFTTVLFSLLIRVNKANIEDRKIDFPDRRGL